MIQAKMPPRNPERFTRVYRVSAFLGLVTNEPRKAEGCSQWSFMDAFATPARLRA
jgi:hypothetical protein